MKTECINIIKFYNKMKNNKQKLIKKSTNICNQIEGILFYFLYYKKNILSKNQILRKM